MILLYSSGRGTFRPDLCTPDLSHWKQTQNRLAMVITSSCWPFIWPHSGLVYYTKSTMKMTRWTERLFLQHPFIMAEHWEHVLLMETLFRANLSGRLLRTSSYTYLLFPYLYKFPKWIMQWRWRRCSVCFSSQAKWSCSTDENAKAYEYRFSHQVTRLSGVSPFTPSQS